MPGFTNQAATMMDETRRRRFRFRLRGLLLAVAVLAVVLVVVIQQVQIGRQQAQIKQMRLQIDRYAIERSHLTDIIREQRDHIERHK